jgi:prophage DNA circulation protein
MAAFDALLPMSFAGVAFPYKTYSVTGALRKHIHEYPHAAGGAPEKLGRSLYEITAVVDFAAELEHPTYFRLLSDLVNHRRLFEDGTTAALHIPHIGTIQAFADTWKETVHGTNRNTVIVELKFIEDQAAAALVFDAIRVSPRDFNTAAKDFQILTEGLESDRSVWTNINDIAIQVFGLFDQANLYGSLVAAKIESFSALLRHVDATVKSLGDPENWPIRESLDRLRETLLDLNDDIQQRNRLLREYEVPFRMSVGQVSAAIYGDYTRGGEIMQLNILPDPLQIQPGTVIRYYQAA